MKLPEEFIANIRRLLTPEAAEGFFAAYDQPVLAGLRVNTLKISADELQRIAPFKLTPVSWAAEGFYYDRQERPAKHPYYHAGLYYLQEPSAMAPAAVLAPRPGDRVLDLCAAPGGKTTQLAAAMQGEGLLVANDLGSDRVKVLVKNVELAGITNAIIVNETPERLAPRFQNFFDKVLVDVPCSGEGMFRKDAGVMAAWTGQSYLAFSRTQLQLLQTASTMVRPGGKLLYSTCTFTPLENEEVILQFLRNNPDFHLLDIPKTAGFAPGITAQGECLSAVARLWPHLQPAEGHFLALLERKEGADAPLPSKNQLPKVALETYRSFVSQYLQKVDFDRCFITYGEYLYSQPHGLPSLHGLKIVRPGLYLGQLKKQRFEPSHALAMAVRADQAVQCMDFTGNDPDVIRYLKAETLPNTMEGKGWVLMCVAGYPLGWAKATPEGLKNYYTSAWRWVD